MTPRRWLVSAAALFAGAGLSMSAPAFAQAPRQMPPVVTQPEQLPPAQPTPPPTPVLGDPIIPAEDFRGPASPRVWASADYLLWWVKSSHLGIPLATNGTFAGGGTVGTPGVTTLIGPQAIDYGITPGARFTLGGWLGNGNLIGIEGSGFLLEKRAIGNAVSNTGTDRNNALFIPYVNAGTGAPDSLFLGFPAQGVATQPIAGSIGFSSSTQFWGAELNGLARLFATNTCTFDAIGGFRYLHLEESFDISANAQLNQTTSAGGPFQSSARDHFHTRNQAYGGQVGFRAAAQFGGFSVTATGKVLLGTVHQVIDVSGQTSSTGGTIIGASPNLNNGIFTQPSNVGTQYRDVFTAAPEANLQFAYDVTRWLRLGVAYNFIYLPNVVRPADQLDARLNYPNTLGRSFLGGPAAPVSSLPASQFNTTSFWAQGVNFTVELRY